MDILKNGQNYAILHPSSYRIATTVRVVISNGLVRTDFSKKPYTFTVHQWTHSWFFKYNVAFTSIHTLAPNASLYPNL